MLECLPFKQHNIKSSLGRLSTVAGVCSPVPCCRGSLQQLLSSSTYSNGTFSAHEDVVQLCQQGWASSAASACTDIGRQLIGTQLIPTVSRAIHWLPPQHWVDSSSCMKSMHGEVWYKFCLNIKCLSRFEDNSDCFLLKYLSPREPCLLWMDILNTTLLLKRNILWQCSWQTKDTFMCAACFPLTQTLQKWLVKDLHEHILATCYRFPLQGKWNCSQEAEKPPAQPDHATALISVLKSHLCFSACHWLRMDLFFHSKLLLWVISYNHRMATRSGCPGLHTTWPWMSPDMKHPQSFYATYSSNSPSSE